MGSMRTCERESVRVSTPRTRCGRGRCSRLLLLLLLPPCAMLALPGVGGVFGGVFSRSDVGSDCDCAGYGGGAAATCRSAAAFARASAGSGIDEGGGGSGIEEAGGGSGTVAGGGSGTAGVGF